MITLRPPGLSDDLDKRQTADGVAEREAAGGQAGPIRIYQDRSGARPPRTRATGESNGSEVAHVARREPVDAKQLGQRHDRTIDEAQTEIREAR